MASEQSAEDCNALGIAAAGEVLRDAYGDHDPEGVAQECFTAYLKAIQGHPHSAANILAIINERDRLREALRRVREAKLVTPDAAWVGESPYLIACAALDSEARS